MDHLISILLVPGAIVLVLLFVILKVVNAIVKLVSVALLLAILAGGYLAYGRVSSIQKAIDAATTQGQAGLMSQVALENTVYNSAKQAMTSTGMNPAYLRINVHCAGPKTQIQLRYTDDSFLFGLLSNQDFDVPHDPRVRC